MNTFRGFELHNDVIDELTNSKIKDIQEYIDRRLKKKLSRKSNQKVFKTEIDENVNKFTHISNFKYIRENFDKVKIGISSWETTNEQWKASVNGNPDLSLERYQRFVSLLNRVMKDINKPEYFVLPELACPANWFMFFAQKLQKKKISLISGIEYRHHKDDKYAVSNQTWAALSFDGFDFPYWILYRQDKQRPAIHEEHELFTINDKKLVPMNKWKTPPIINHGGFYFAILNCNEITNIEYRASLRGKVDALFAIEWNKDTESFKSIVEASALDIHTYIIQCNNRLYGDSRIRAPYKENWQRDIVRIKGGKSDYYVIGEIDIKALRKFQQNHRSPEQPFKPMPDGFELSSERNDFPKKGTN